MSEGAIVSTVVGSAYTEDMALVEVFDRHCSPAAGSLVDIICRQVARGSVVELGNMDQNISLVYPSIAPLNLKLRDLVDEISAFPLLRSTGELPSFASELTRRLYATYLTCLEQAEISYPLDMKSDARGTLASILRSPHLGQIYVSRTKPGIVRANHFHDYKTEKFLVVEGEAAVRLRHVDSDQIMEFRVTGSRFEIVDIPPGYVHTIENIGCSEMVLIFWVSEQFDPARTDTHTADVDHH